jgi:hypothetical protein
MVDRPSQQKVLSDWPPSWTPRPPYRSRDQRKNDRCLRLCGSTVYRRWEHRRNSAPGLQNAAATVRNLVDLTTGQVGSVLGNPPNGSETSTMPAFNSLANMLAACVNAPAECLSLFDLATPPRGSVPRDTLQAVVNIARYPWQNVESLFETVADRYSVPACSDVNARRLDTRHHVHRPGVRRAGEHGRG